jgi:hypothetical protein
MAGARSFTRIALTSAIFFASSAAHACVVEIPFSAYTDVTALFNAHPIDTASAQGKQNEAACEASLDRILAEMQQYVDNAVTDPQQRGYINIEKENNNTQALHAGEAFGVCKAGTLHPLNYYVEYGIKDDRGENQGIASTVDFCLAIEQKIATLHLDSDATNRTAPSDNQTVYKIDRVNNTPQTTDVPGSSNNGQ